MNKEDNKEIFNKLKSDLMNFDPVHFCQEYLTLEGKPFTLSGNGYKPFADIYRYIGIKALEPNAKPVIIVKGRQVGATTMASALEMYFMGSGLVWRWLPSTYSCHSCFSSIRVSSSLF